MLNEMNLIPGIMCVCVWVGGSKWFQIEIQRFNYSSYQKWRTKGNARKKTLNSDFTMGRYNFIRTVKARLCQFTKYVNFGILCFADAIRTLVYTIYA